MNKNTQKQKKKKIVFFLCIFIYLFIFFLLHSTFAANVGSRATAGRVPPRGCARSATNSKRWGRVGAGGERESELANCWPLYANFFFFESRRIAFHRPLKGKMTFHWYWPSVYKIWITGTDLFHFFFLFLLSLSLSLSIFKHCFGLIQRDEICRNTILFWCSRVFAEMCASRSPGSLNKFPILSVTHLRLPYDAATVSH